MVFISPLLFSIKQSYLSGLDDLYLVYLFSFWSVSELNLVDLQWKKLKLAKPSIKDDSERFFE